MKKTITMIVLAVLPGILLAQEPDNYRCTYGDLTRRVEIAHETGVAVPCEVHYYKDTEAPGEQQVLWRALNEAGYCEARTREFIARLEGMGWSCAANDAAPAAGMGDSAADADDMAEADDTGDLAPAEDIEIPPSEPR